MYMSIHQLVLHHENFMVGVTTMLLLPRLLVPGSRIHGGWGQGQGTGCDGVWMMMRRLVPGHRVQGQWGSGGGQGAGVRDPGFRGGGGQGQGRGGRCWGQSAECIKQECSKVPWPSTDRTSSNRIHIQAETGSESRLPLDPDSGCSWIQIQAVARSRLSMQRDLM